MTDQDKDKEKEKIDELLKELQFYRKILHDPRGGEGEPFEPWPTQYIMQLWDDPALLKVLNFYMLGDQLADNPQNEEALELIYQRYLTRYQVFPSPEQRIYLEKVAWMLLDESIEELRDHPRDSYTWWADAVAKPAILTTWATPEIPATPATVYDPAKKHKPSFKEWFERKNDLEIIKLVRGKVRRAITGDLRNRDHPYGISETKFILMINDTEEGPDGLLLPAINPASEEGIKAKTREYKYGFYPKVERAFDPVNAVSSYLLFLLGIDTGGWETRRILLLYSEISKLSEHQSALIQTFKYRGSLQKYAQECGKSVSSLYKERNRLAKELNKNVQKRLKKPDTLLGENT